MKVQNTDLLGIVNQTKASNNCMLRVFSIDAR